MSAGMFWLAVGMILLALICLSIWWLLVNCFRLFTSVLKREPFVPYRWDDMVSGMQGSNRYQPSTWKQSARSSRPQQYQWEQSARSSRPQQYSWERSAWPSRPQQYPWEQSVGPSRPQQPTHSSLPSYYYEDGMHSPEDLKLMESAAAYLVMTEQVDDFMEGGWDNVDFFL